MGITFNTTTINPNYIFRATGGGIIFSANLKDLASFDYFKDDAVIGDCIYFGAYRRGSFQNINLNIGTTIVADNIVIAWEYATTSGWLEFEKGYKDETSGFTVSGQKTFYFGYPQDWNSRTTINGVYASWVRARIKSVTNITEGGANTTDTVTFNTGDCDITGYSDISPCTLSLVYDYLSTNYDYLDIFKDDDNFHYDLSAVNLRIYSRLKMSNESLFLGFCDRGGAYSTELQLGYLQMGDKIDDNTGKNGSILTLKGAANTYHVYFGNETKIYGSTVKSNYGSGYPAWQGEWIDSFIDSINFSGGLGSTVRNCRIVFAGTYIASSFPDNFVNNTIIVDGTYFAYFYNSDVTIPGATFRFDSGTHYILYFYQTGSTPTYTFLNPDPLLPGIDTTNKIINRASGSPYANFTKVWYYDDSEGTYTDYTTEFSNDTEDNAPISGDVGDIYYFAPGTGSWWNMHLGITSNLTENNNKYIWEFYAYGTWYELTQWDNTNNFLGNGEMWFGKEQGYSGTSLNINGYTARWFRMRIIESDHTQRNITRIKYRTETGASEWNVYEKFSLDLNVTDIDGVPLKEATVNIYLDDELVYTDETNINGDMTQEYFINRHWYFDPINCYDNYKQICEDTKNKYKLEIIMGGYQTYTDYFYMNEQRELKVSLLETIPPIYNSAQIDITVDSPLIDADVNTVSIENDINNPSINVDVENSVVDVSTDSVIINIE